jgi:hypothetical protein
MFPPALGLAPLHVKPEPPNPKQQIILLISELDRYIQHPVAISPLSMHFGITTRRLYDFINILSAIGCCRRSGLDLLIWMGRAQIPPFVSELRRLRDVDNAERTLCDLFPVSDCVGMSNLTSCFLLVFHALRTTHLNLRFVGQLFSRKTQRYKSTLCKLYQIVFVLCAAGICSRTAQTCEVVLLDAYIDFIVVPADASGPLGIDALLNRKKANFVIRRRKEFHDLFAASVVSKAVLLADNRELWSTINRATQ